MAVCLSLLIGGCKADYQASPTIPPTSPPQPTLIAHAALSSTPAPPVAPNFDPPPAFETTPTPFLYTVQEGETLLQIARRFGVDADYLQAVNGAVEPRNLQIGQVLLIPDALFNAEGVPLYPTTPPRYFSLPPPQCTLAATERMVCLGQVANPSAEPLVNSRVRVRIYRPDGSVLAEGETSIEQAIIPAGEIAPYHVSLIGDWSQFSGAAALLETHPFTTTPHLGLPTQGEQRRGNMLSVRVYNPTAETVLILRAVLTDYDSLGRVIGYRVAAINQLLVSGGEVALNLRLEQPPATVTHHLYVEGLRVRG